MNPRHAHSRSSFLRQRIARPSAILLLVMVHWCILGDGLLFRRATSEGINSKASVQEIVAASLTDLQTHGEYLYWLDKRDKGIYRARAPKQNVTSPQSPATAVEPEKLWNGLPLASPVGITVDSAGVVYVLDDQVKGVFSLATVVPKLLYSGIPLAKPTAIAAAGDSIFVIDSGTDKLYSIDPARGELAFAFDFNGDTPDRLRADGTDLITYKFASNVLFHFSINNSPDLAKEPATERSDFTKLTSGRKLTLNKILSDVIDLSLKNGIIYFIDQSSAKLVLLALKGKEPAFLPLTLVSNNPSALTASPDSIFFAEGQPLRVRRQPSLQPLTLKFFGESNSKQVVEFYSYLQDKKLLPSRTITIASRTTLKDLVTDLKLLPAGYVDDFQLLFCRMNESVCKPEQTKLPAEGTTAPDGFAVTLNEGQSIVILDLSVDPYTAQRNEKINSSLDRVATELGPKTWTRDQVFETVRSYNRDYVGADVLSATEGNFTIPVQGVQVTAVVALTDLLAPKSRLRRLAEEKDITAFSPIFQIRQEAQSAQQPAAHATISNSQPFADGCLPNDPTIRSAAMDLINYCEPVLTEIPRVGIIDYLFDAKHPAFTLGSGVSALEVFTQDDQSFEDTSIDVDPMRTTYDQSVDHGTHIAAIIGARAQPGIMVGMLPTANLYGVPIQYLQEAMERFHRVHIFNVSLGDKGANGGPFSGTAELENLMDTRRLELFVLSAGNEDRALTKHDLAALGTLDNVLVVGATDVPDVGSNNQRPARSVWRVPNKGKGSNRHGSFVGLMAPGEKIKSALHKGQFGLADGTSEATAYVSGAAAALMALEPNWSAWQVKFRLVATADLWTGKLSESVLAGELNFKRAMSDRDAVLLERQVPQGMCRGDMVADSFIRKLVIKQPGQPRVSIPWTNILRIKRDHPTGTEYTILYYKLNTLFDRDNRQLLRLSKVTAQQLRENDWFEFTPRDASNCEGGRVKFVDVLDFINKGPFPPDTD